MASRQTFVDIHCHLAPGIDDGANSWDDCLAMAKMAAADGIKTVVVTPHQLGNYSHNSGDAIRDLAVKVQDFLHSHRVPLRILPGADVRIESGMVTRLRRGDVLTLADRRRHVLLELPHELYLPLEPLLAELSAAGMVGILSHPERNLGILSNPSLIGPLVDGGCLMQVTAGSVLGAFGPRVQKISEDLLSAGLVHFISTDAHGTRSRRPLMRKAFDRVAHLTNAATAIELCSNNPNCVAEGRDVIAGRRQKPRRSWAGWIPWRKAA